MNLSTVKDALLRRLSANYVNYLGGGDFKSNSKTKDWCEGYFQAKRDAEAVLKQLAMFDNE